MAFVYAGGSCVALRLRLVPSLRWWWLVVGGSVSQWSVCVSTSGRCLRICSVVAGVEHRSAGGPVRRSCGCRNSRVCAGVKRERSERGGGIGEIADSSQVMRW